MLLRRWDVPKERMRKNRKGEKVPKQLSRTFVNELMYHVTNHVPPRN